MSVFWSWLGYPDIHIYADCWHLGGSGEKLAGSREIRLEPGVRLRGKSASPSPSLSPLPTIHSCTFLQTPLAISPMAANRAASKSISRLHAFDPLPHQSIDVAILMLHLICSFSTSTQFPHPITHPATPPFSHFSTPRSHSLSPPPDEHTALQLSLHNTFRCLSRITLKTAFPTQPLPY